ncbi:MAG: hypothetical protein QMD85_00065, partial [Candidatus Aenigmarchaeota archaeon]|nr:hypothetical protein [Candidatus Aenigmarchaeota archaeon]MDI6721923.1 hypothetical protein [Candidatus Aenigmarchaeota archaeon]
MLGQHKKGYQLAYTKKIVQAGGIPRSFASGYHPLSNGKRGRNCVVESTRPTHYIDHSKNETFPLDGNSTYAPGTIEARGPIYETLEELRLSLNHK